MVVVAKKRKRLLHGDGYCCEVSVNVSLYYHETAVLTPLENYIKDVLNNICTVIKL